MTNPKMSAADWGIIMLLSLLWGGAFFMIESGLRGFPPNTLVFLRMALAVPPMFLILGVVALNESIEAKELAGAALISLGLPAVDGRLWPKFSASASA